MHLSQKKVCGNCRARGIDSSKHCELGFKRKDVGYKPPFFISKMVPTEECYKPLTTKEYFEARALAHPSIGR